MVVPSKTLARAGEAVESISFTILLKVTFLHHRYAVFRTRKWQARSRIYFRLRAVFAFYDAQALSGPSPGFRFDPK